MPDNTPRLTDEEQRRYVEALEALPLLTRTVFLLASRDSFPYLEIGWRCGISVEEVRSYCRCPDGSGHMRAGPCLAARIRRALLPWRDAWWQRVREKAIGDWCPGFRSRTGRADAARSTGLPGRSSTPCADDSASYAGSVSFECAPTASSPQSQRLVASVAA